jgi:hypothetical protein
MLQSRKLKRKTHVSSSTSQAFIPAKTRIISSDENEDYFSEKAHKFQTILINPLK